MKFRWTLPTPPSSLPADLAGKLGIPPLLAQCLANRRLASPELVHGFLEPRLRNLGDPFLLPDASRAVERLFRARELPEPVVIFGDYDVDGVTSTALLLEFLSAMGWQVSYYLPHRLDEGYGLTLESAERCLAKSPARLVLAVDCGSSACDCIRALQQRGVDVIVLDHHQVSSPVPAALALVNPRARSPALENALSSERPAWKESDSSCLPPNFELCSVGLAFKLAHALLKRARQLNIPGAAEYDLRPLLDLVALGTVADLVPLTGENRILVQAGLARLNRTTRPGLVALKEVLRTPTALGVHEVGYQLAPRLNAAGRLETAEDALRLLLAPNLTEARFLAATLEARNRERQQIEQAISEAVIRRVQERFNPKDDFVIVEGHMLWHIGVVGIVASRVLQQFHRPTIIVGGDGAEWRGSGRSIAGFDLAGALGQCSDILVRHGGHAMAAGLTLKRENIDGLRARLNAFARSTLSPDQLLPSLRLDGEVQLADLNFDCLRWLDRLNPTGQGNPPPHFYVSNVRHQRPFQRIGADQRHVKMWVTDGAATHQAVWWGAGNESLPEGPYDLAFIPQLNEYKGERVVQLKVLDWRPASPQ